MKKIILALLLILIPALAGASIVRYALVQEGQIVKHFGVESADSIKIAKLVAHGYLPIVEGAAPPHNAVLQVVSDTLTVSSTQVDRTYTVSNKPLAEAKSAAMEWLNDKALDKIRESVDRADAQTVIRDILIERARVKNLIAAAVTVEELLAIKPTWPA